MALSVEIDAHSGFCGGVIRAIQTAEDYLSDSSHSHMYSLGAIVHNESEQARLESKGLVTIDQDDLQQMLSATGQTLLIRAHGEPPQTYTKAADLGFNVVDCTCPVVLRIQESIRAAKGQVLIFGKPGHPEVLGLVGQVDGNAIVFDAPLKLETLVAEGKIRVDSPIEIFSQTTMSPVGYEAACAFLRSSVTSEELLTVHQTICNQVASRHRELSAFAASHDVIVFVSGKTSSNGKVLSELCRSVNIRTYHVCTVDDVRGEWFHSSDKVGVCGATSTPRWLLEQVATHIENLQ